MGELGDQKFTLEQMAERAKAQQALLVAFPSPTTMATVPGAGSRDPATSLTAPTLLPPLQTRTARSPVPTPCRPTTCFGCMALRGTKTGWTSVCAC